MFTPLAIAIAVSFASAEPASSEPPETKQRVAIRVIPPTHSGDPWVVVTDATAREVLTPNGKAEFTPLRLVVRRVKVEGGKNFSVRVFVNSLRANAETPVKDPHHIGYASFFPQRSDNPGFIMNPVRALRNLAAEGNLRMDRPLIFTFALVPEDPGRPLAYKDWTIEDVSLIVAEK